jgi:hypothetical protein
MKNCTNFVAIFYKNFWGKCDIIPFNRNRPPPSSEGQGRLAWPTALYIYSINISVKLMPQKTMIFFIQHGLNYYFASCYQIELKKIFVFHSKYIRLNFFSTTFLISFGN